MNGHGGGKTTVTEGPRDVLRERLSDDQARGWYFKDGGFESSSLTNLVLAEISFDDSPKSGKGIRTYEALRGYFSRLIKV